VRDEGEDLAPESRAVAREVRYPGGFDDFFRTEYRSLVKALMIMDGACPADAADCVANAMESIFKRWHIRESDIGHVRHPRRYALKAAQNYLRKERRRAQTVQLDNDEPGPAVDEPVLTAMESQKFVADVLKCLTPGERPVMHLISEGYTQVEIAEMLRKEPNNIRQIAWQARKKLRSLLDLRTTSSPGGEEEVL
jgi:RNA polymerase sigma factor (sigma-70 family)